MLDGFIENDVNRTNQGFATPTQRLMALKEKGIDVFDRYFESPKKWIDTLLEVYREKVRAHECVETTIY